MKLKQVPPGERIEFDLSVQPNKFRVQRFVVPANQDVSISLSHLGGDVSTVRIRLLATGEDPGQGPHTLQGPVLFFDDEVTCTAGGCPFASTLRSGRHLVPAGEAHVILIRAQAPVAISLTAAVSARSPPRHGFLGIMWDPDRNLTVEHVAPGTSAAESGLKRGDVVTAIDGHQLSDERNASDILKDTEPGDSVDLTFHRNGIATTVRVQLTSYDDFTDRLRQSVLEANAPSPAAPTSPASERRASPAECEPACENVVRIFLDTVDKEARRDSTLDALGSSGAEMAREMAALQVDHLRYECRKTCGERGTIATTQCLVGASSKHELDLCGEAIPLKLENASHPSDVP